MKRKGFTLVELLAVIAILAILVIIALPNVLKMFNDSKKNSFLTETKTVYSEISKKYISDSMKDNTNSNYVYCKSNTDTLNPINLSGRDINYYVKTDASGKINSIVVWDNERYVAKKGSINATDLNDALDITDDIKNASCDNIFEKVGFEEDIDQNVTNLLNTTWKLNNEGYSFKTLNNKLTDLSCANINFVSNGKNYIGIDSLYLPFSIPSTYFKITFCGVETNSTVSSLEKISFPFGNYIEEKNGIIAYVISETEGVYVPYYQYIGWYTENEKILTITGGADVENHDVINWLKEHGKRIKESVKNFV